MNKRMKEILDNYIIYPKEEMTINEELSHAYNYGYYDGYFDELVYLEMIQNKEIIANYMRGFSDGMYDRINLDTIQTMEDEKDAWLKKIAAWDGITNNTKRNLRLNARKQYDVYRTMEFKEKEIKLKPKK